LAVVADGRLIVLIEFERVTGIRYGWPKSPVGSLAAWNAALDVLRSALVAVDSMFLMTARHFDVAVLSVETAVEIQVPGSLEHVISASRWELADHHQSHALYAFWDSPFEAATIVSFDGSGMMAHSMYTTAASMDRAQPRRLLPGMMRRIDTYLVWKSSALHA
jgi:predicted NodU family carbamoyl transferase